MKRFSKLTIAFVLILSMIMSGFPAVYATGNGVDMDALRNEPPTPDEMPLSSPSLLTFEQIEMTVEDDVITVTSVPNYYQNYYYYSDLPYGKGTLASSGCGITCISMIATYMLDDPTLTPDVFAMDFGLLPGGNLDRLLYASDFYGLTYERTYDWWELVEALEDGKIAIILVSPETKFTTVGHFMVATGITDDGRILLNDPNYWNYGKFEYDFEYGFHQNDFTSGFCGAWIYDKSTME